jgi:hypothetical protein
MHIRFKKHVLLFVTALAFAINSLPSSTRAQTYIARGGQILDASIVPVPRNRNTRDENKAIKAGEEPRERGSQAQAGPPLPCQRCRPA